MSARPLPAFLGKSEPTALEQLHEFYRNQSAQWRAIADRIGPHLRVHYTLMAMAAEKHAENCKAEAACSQP